MQKTKKKKKETRTLKHNPSAYQPSLMGRTLREQWLDAPPAPPAPPLWLLTKWWVKDVTVGGY